MRATVLIVVLLGASGCDDAVTNDATDGGVTDGSAIDAIPIDAGDGCATPPVGDWTGTTREHYRGAGAFEAIVADVVWTRVATHACVDRYQPSGTATWQWGGHWCDSDDVTTPATTAIAPTDGELIVDRTTAPPTYTMRGETEWAASVHCSEDPPGTPGQVGGRWAAYDGAFDGPVFGGGLTHENGFEFSMRWRFTRVGAVFTPPTACAAAPVEQWTSTSSFDHHTAAATWTRVATEGCIDTYAATGTVTLPPRSTAYCAPLTYDPPTRPITADDGVLTIDRSTSPIKFLVEGNTTWPTTRHCTRPDGTIDSLPQQGGGGWAGFTADVAGDAFAGGFERADDRWAWRFTRL